VTNDHSYTPRLWQQSAIGDRRSVVGSIVIILIVALCVLGIPFLADNVEGSLDTDESGRFIVDAYTSLLIPEGWSIQDQNDLLLTLTDGTYQFIIIVSVPTDETDAAGLLQSVYDGYASDSANVLTPIVPFATDAGGAAAGYRAQLVVAPGQGSANYGVIQNGRAFQPFFIGPSDLSDPFYDEADAIVATVEITAEPREGER